VVTSRVGLARNAGPAFRALMANSAVSHKGADPLSEPCCNVGSEPPVFRLNSRPKTPLHLGSSILKAPVAARHFRGRLASMRW